MKVKLASLFIMLFIAAPFLIADDYSDLKKQIQKERAELERLSDSKADVSAKLNMIASVMAKNKKLLYLADSEIKKNEEAVRSIGREIASVNKKIDSSRRGIKKSNIYMIDTLGYADVMILADAGSLSDVIMTLEILSSANESLVENISALHLDVLNLKELKKDEESGRIKLEDDLKTKKAALKESAELKRSYTASMQLVKNDIAAQEEYLNQLRFKQKELEDIIRKQSTVKANKDYNDGSLFYRSKGKMNLPMKGSIIERYGNHSIDGMKVNFFNKGIKIETASTSDVFAPYPGTVIFADQLKGFLNLVVLSHDGAYYTVYGNLSMLKVKTGDKLMQGDAVGTIGVALDSDETYLYFELRKGEEALDPLKWFR